MKTLFIIIILFLAVINLFIVSKSNPTVNIPKAHFLSDYANKKSMNYLDAYPSSVRFRFRIPADSM